VVSRMLTRASYIGRLAFRPIQNYFILKYTTICDLEKYDYIIEDGHESLIDQNHGALDGKNTY